MSAIRNPAQEAFEQNKDNPQVQAMLKALGAMREQVVEWEIKSDKSNKTYPYRAVFANGDEMQGEIMYVWQHKEWIASGSIIPAEIAASIRERSIEWYGSGRGQ